MKILKHKRPILIVFIILILVLLVAIPFYLHRASVKKIEQLRKIPVTYFSLINEGRLDESFAMLHIEAGHEAAMKMIYDNYKQYPAKNENIQTGETIGVC